MENIEPADGKRSRHWLRGLRPLLWWLALVLVLFAIHTHQVLSEQTRLLFSASLPGQGIFNEPSASLDRKPVESGEKISIGWHTFTLTHPKAELFATNLFIWNGLHNLGQINLKRAKGVLDLHVDPKVPLLTIRGPEFTEILTNSSGITVSVPTDVYTVEAKYAHWQQQNEITIFDRVTNCWRIAPRLGSLSLTCNRDGASFELLTTDNRIVEAGGFPATVTELPEGKYALVALHHRNRREQHVTATFGATGNVMVEWVYGNASVTTEPSGAKVSTADGREWGMTPLTLAELPVGTWDFTVRLDGYEPASASVQVTAGETASLRTNLVSRNYTAAMNAAERYFSEGDFERAEKAADEALLAKRDDPAASELRNQAYGFASLRRAEALGKRGDYIAGIKELETTLNALPGNSEAEQLFADFRQREHEQHERIWKARIDQTRAAFDAFAHLYREATLFERHELKTSKAASVAAKAIEDALWDIPPHFVIPRRTSQTPGISAFEAVQEVPDGLRRCLVTVGQTREDEALIIFEVLEYKNHRKVTMDSNLRVTVTTEHIPVHPSHIPDMTDKLKAQVEEGKRIVAEYVERAIQK